MIRTDLCKMFCYISVKLDSFPFVKLYSGLLHSNIFNITSLHMRNGFGRAEKCKKKFESKFQGDIL